MHLTREEERIYDGELGWANQVSMKILVRLGELFNASKLIPISSAHVSGVSYKTLGDAPVEFLEALTKSGARARCEATLNPQSSDCEYLCKRLPSELCRRQADILKCFDRMGVKPSLTCTPYYLEKPRKGSHVAWAESSAVVYANSVLHAWTNREGGPSALAAAIIGKTPDYGAHKAENRKPKVLVKVKDALRTDVEFGALGIFLGEILGDRIPVIEGLKNTSENDLKQLGAALASTGMVNMIYSGDVDVRGSGMERITVGIDDVKRAIDKLTTSQSLKPDLVYVGCPHSSLNEIKQVAELIEGRRIRGDTEFWICTSRFVKEKAGQYVEEIEKRGGHVITDTCAVVTWTDKLGIRTIMTNSAKTAHYAPTLNKAETILAPLRDCVDTAFKG